MTAPSRFHSALNAPLLSFGGERWTIDDATQATAIWGAPGSGKTSGSGRMIARAFLAAGMGGLVLCAKTDEADTWRRYVKETGREDDLIVVDATAAQRFNILDYAAKNLAGRGFEHNLVELVNRMGEAASVADAKGAGGGENRYFDTSALKWVGHAFPLLLLAYETLRMRDLNSFIASAPQSLAEEKAEAEAIKNRKMSASEIPFCRKTLTLAGERAVTYRREADAAIAVYAAQASIIAVLWCYPRSLTILGVIFGALVSLGVAVELLMGPKPGFAVQFPVSAVCILLVGLLLWRLFPALLTVRTMAGVILAPIAIGLSLNPGQVFPVLTYGGPPRAPAVADLTPQEQPISPGVALPPLTNLDAPPQQTARNGLPAAPLCLPVPGGSAKCPRAAPRMVRVPARRDRACGQRASSARWQRMANLTWWVGVTPP